jgi:hypothetical protein
MTTPRAYARDATAALHKALRIAPSDFDTDSATAVIERAIRSATRERESRSRRQLGEAKATAEQRLTRLLSSSPAVIYSFKARGDFAPTFVSDNIAAVFGYTPAEYLENPSFWRDRHARAEIANSHSKWITAASLAETPRPCGRGVEGDTVSRLTRLSIRARRSILEHS